MISARMGSAAVTALVLLSGCGSVGVALGMRTRLDKLPVTAVSAKLSPQASLTPGKSGRLVLVASGTDGKTWTTVGAKHGDVLFDSYKLEPTVVKVNANGYVSLPAAWHDEPDRLREWIGVALEQVGRMPPKEKKPRKPAKPRTTS